MFSLAFFSALVLAAPDETSSPDYTDCVPASHEAWSTSYNKDGSSLGQHDRSNTYCYYDGMASMSEYRGLDKNNQTFYHGVSITIWGENREKARTFWAQVGTADITDMEAYWKDNKLVTKGNGNDPTGAFVERSSTEFYPGGDFQFVMDRSYDNGETWLSPFGTIEYLKTSGLPPSLPTDWAPRMSFGAHFVEKGGMIILDGNAWGKFIENEQGTPIGYKFASVIPEGDNAWVWRTLTWAYEGGFTDINKIPLQ